MNEDVEDREYANVQDKIDWRIIIMRRLDIAHALNNYETRHQFNAAVEKAVNVIGINYPGWNARAAIKNIISKLKQKYRNANDNWYLDHRTSSRAKKNIFNDSLKYAFHQDILSSLGDYCGERRMMLFGKPDSRGLDYMDIDNYGNARKNIRDSQPP